MVEVVLPLRLLHRSTALRTAVAFGLGVVAGALASKLVRTVPVTGAPQLGSPAEMPS